MCTGLKVEGIRSYIGDIILREAERKLIKEMKLLRRGGGKGVLENELYSPAADD